MSSDESSVTSGSRIREFGLYRHIDARTEEFLRLSRKRQIRQGCACAAASTAITVTVAIVVFFIYEFSLNSETRLESSFNSNWLSLMNATSGNSSFDSTITKANIDRTTLKLLPLLIKAIKKNVFLEKLLEDHSTSSPSYEKKETTETTENSFEPNAFSNTWFKMPTTKLLAIEYKTSPVVYFKNPTKNIEYYTKIRKIRDYKRVFNYVDKMISEKVYIRSTRPLLKDETYTEMPVQKLIPLKKPTRKPSTHSQIFSSITPKMNSTEKPQLRCKCSKKLRKLLQKILLNVQKLLPELSNNETKLVECLEKEAKHHKMKSISAKSQVVTIPPRISTLKPLTRRQHKSATSATKQRTRINIIYPQKARTFSFESDLDKILSKDPTKIHSPVTKAYKPYSPTTTMKQNFEKKNKLKSNFQTTTQPNKFMNRYRNVIKRKKFLRNPEVKLSTHEPISDGIEYDDYSYITSTPKVNGVMNNNRIKQNDLNNDDIEIIKINHKIKLPKKVGKNILRPNKSNITNIKGFDNKTKQIQTNKIKTDIDTTYLNKVTNPPKLRKSSLTKTKVVNNKIAPVKIKPLQTNISKKNTHSTYGKLEQVFDTLIPQTNRNIRVFKSKPVNSSKIANEILIQNNGSELPILNEIPNKVTPKTSSSDLNNRTRYKTVYHFTKNDKKTSFFTNKFLKTKPPTTVPNETALNKIININDLKIESQDRTFNNSESNIYQLIENNVKTLLNQDSVLKPKLNNNKVKITRKLHKKNNKIYRENEKESPVRGAGKEIQGPDLIEEDVVYSGDFADVVDNSIIPLNDSYAKEKTDYDLTWEDLTNEPVRSMIPKSKPLYLEYHKTDEKQEEHEEDEFNFNSNNFYDLVI